MNRALVTIIALCLLGCSDPPSRDWLTYKPQTDGAAPAGFSGEHPSLPTAAPSAPASTGGAEPASRKSFTDMEPTERRAFLRELAKNAPPPPEPAKPIVPTLPTADLGADLPYKAAPRGLVPPEAPPAEEPDDLAAADLPRKGALTDVPAHWTGAVIYCQPGCVPCAMEIRDLKAAGWKVGVGDAAHFKIVELLKLDDFSARGVPSTPQTVYYVDGVEQPPRITGYDGQPATLTMIASRHAKAKKANRFGTAQGASPLWYDAPLGCSRPALVAAPNCAMPKANCGAPLTAVGPLTDAAGSVLTTLAPVGSVTCGSPVVASVVEGAPVVTSVITGPATYSTIATDCVLPAYSYSAPQAVVCEQWAQPSMAIAPMRVAPSAGLTVGPAVHSAQLNVFGFPLIGGSIGTQANW